MIKVDLGMEIPKELLLAYLQHIRDFDTKHDPEKHSVVHFSILITGDVSTEEAAAAFAAVKPPFDITYHQRWKRKPA